MIDDIDEKRGYIRVQRSRETSEEKSVRRNGNRKGNKRESVKCNLPYISHWRCRVTSRCKGTWHTTEYRSVSAIPQNVSGRIRFIGGVRDTRTKLAVRLVMCIAEVPLSGGARLLLCHVIGITANKGLRTTAFIALNR